MTSKPTYEELELRIKKLEQEAVVQKQEAKLVHDITYHKRAEEALRANEEEYRSILNNLLIGVVVHASDTSVLLSNQTAVNILGLTDEQMTGKKAIDSAWNFVHEDSTIMKIEDYPVSRVFSTKKPLYDYILGVNRPDRDYVTWLIVNAMPIFSNDSELEKVIVNFVDITELKQAEKSLRESETRFRALHNASFGGIALHDKGIILECNQGLSEITGYSVTELIGMDGLLLIAEDSRDAVMNNIVTGYEKPYEAIGLRKNGETFPIRIEARNVPYKGKNVRTVEFRDITEKKQADADREKLQNQLIQSQKMEAIGTLAGGIAHDFNNILSPLVGYSEMLKEDLLEGSPLQDNADEILHAALRAKELVKQILTFSHQSDTELQPIKLQPIVKEALKLLRSSIPTTIEIQHNIDPDCGIVIADSTQTHQIVMNLATNAYHAMEETGGKLIVSLKQVRLETGQSLIPELIPGEYALLTVADTGIGIKENVMGKVFDPYFTTKGLNKGTGLGLSVVQGIVQRYSGKIHIHSEPGKGTEIQVYLPIKGRKVNNIRAVENESIQGGTERILLVDDELSIIKMTQRLLERLGYRVTCRTGSVEAFEVFKAYPDSFDLIITDMTMPNMNGVQLAREIRNIRPKISVIICTGFSDQIDEEKSKALGIQGFLVKPISKQEIAGLIRKVLDY